MTGESCSAVLKAALFHLSRKDASLDEKQVQLEHLRHLASWNRAICQTLIVALADSSESIRKHAVDVILEKFTDAPSAEARYSWFEMILTFMLTKSAVSSEDLSLIHRMETWIRRHRHEVPELFIRLTQEVLPAIKRSHDPRVCRALLQFQEQASSEPSLRSSSTLQRLSDARLREVLLSREASVGSLGAALETLRRRPVDEISLDILVYHLAPIIDGHDIVAMLEALGNLNHWGSQFQGKKLLELPALLKTLRQYRSGSSSLPTGVLNQIGAQAIIIDPLVKLIPELARSARYQSAIAQILNVLLHLGNLRGHIESLCLFLEGPNVPSDAFKHGVEVLSSVLTSLNPEKQKDNPAWKFFYDDSIKKTDDLVRQCLLTIVERSSVPMEARQLALRSIISSRPPNLDKTLKRLLAKVSHKDPLYDTALAVLSDEHMLGETDTIKWLLGKARSETSTERVIRVFEEFGQDKSAAELASILGSSSSATMSQKAGEALLRAGYSEQVHKVKTAHLVKSLGKEIRETMRRTVSLEDRFRSLSLRIMEEELQYRRLQQRALDIVLDRGITSSETQVKVAALDITKAEEDLRLDVLLNSAVESRRAIASHLRAIVRGSETLRVASQEIADLGVEVDGLRQQIDAKQNELDAFSKELKRLKNNKPNQPDGPSESSQKDHVLALQFWEMETSFLEEEKRHLDSTIPAWKERLNTLISSHQRETARLATLRSSGSVARRGSVRNAVGEVEEINRRIVELESVQAETRHRREQLLRDTLRDLERREGEVSKTRKGIIELASEVSELKRDIENHKTRYQRISQHLDEERKAYEKSISRSRSQNQLVDSRAIERAEFFLAHRTLEDEAKRHAEFTIDQVFQERIEVENEEQLLNIREQMSKRDMK